MSPRLPDCPPLDIAAMDTQLGLVPADQLQRWRGLRLVYLATPEGAWHHRFTPPVTSVALMDSGRIEGQIRTTGRARDVLLRAGSLALFTGGQEVRAYQSGAHAARRVIVDLDAAGDSAGLLDEAALPPLQPSTGFDDPALALLVRAMLREVRQGCPHGALYAESLSLGLLLHLRRTRGAPAAPRRGERGRLSGRQHARLDELIADELTGELSLATLCGALGLSKTHFVRLFRNTTGTSPHRYVMHKRLERARALIVGGDLPLVEVASAAGFASQSHLNRHFRLAFGVTPGAARQRSGH